MKKHNESHEGSVAGLVVGLSGLALMALALWIFSFQAENMDNTGLHVLFFFGIAVTMYGLFALKEN